jgi:hypothetical protein
MGAKTDYFISRQRILPNGPPVWKEVLKHSDGLKEVKLVARLK